MVALRWALALLALVLLAAPAGAQGASDAWIELAASEGVWNGVSGARVRADGETPLWLPAGARLHGVVWIHEPPGEPERETLPSWRALGSDGIVVSTTPGEPGRVEARFDVREGAVQVARYVAPAAVERLEVKVRPDDARVPLAEGVAFAETAPGHHVAVAGPFAQGESLVLRAVAPDRIGELPVLLAVLGLALVALASTFAFHKLRPPLQGRPPEKFLDHLVELQARLLPAALVFAVLNVFYFTCGLRVLDVGAVRLVVPTFDVTGSLATRAFEAFAERLVPPNVELVALRPVDAVLAQVQMALFLSFASALPLFAYEIGAFLGPALVDRERRFAARVLPLVLGLFVGGALVGLVIMAPLMLETLYSYAPTLGARALVSLSDLVSFAILISLAFGFAFELPVAMHALARLGVVRASTFRRYFRHAVVVIFVAAGVLTPDPSVVSQLLVALPVTGLYGLGIGAAWWGERARPPAA